MFFQGRSGSHRLTAQRMRLSTIVTLVAMTMLLPAYPVVAHQPSQAPSPELTLSPYWTDIVRRWEPVILEYAERNGLDPDLVAAVIWKESRGLYLARGPAGAVGLMQVMPREEGFSWRPTVEQLEQPWINVHWGTMALAKAARESEGDLYNALAAYNGGWDQIHLSGPRRFSSDVLGYYVRAVAMRCGLPPEGHWVATVGPVHQRSRGVVTVLGPQREIARYSDRPIVAHIPESTTQGPPTAVAFTPQEAHLSTNPIGVWIVMDGQLIRPDGTEEASGRTTGTSGLPAQADVIQAAWIGTTDQRHRTTRGAGRVNLLTEQLP